MQWDDCLSGWGSLWFFAGARESGIFSETDAPPGGT